jgi:hypothetical protein
MVNSLSILLAMSLPWTLSRDSSPFLLGDTILSVALRLSLFAKSLLRKARAAGFFFTKVSRSVPESEIKIPMEQIAAMRIPGKRSLNSKFLWKVDHNNDDKNLEGMLLFTYINCCGIL